MAETLSAASFVLKQSVAFTRPFFFGTTSQTVTVQISKNGGAFAAVAGGGGAVAEVGGAGNGLGWYTVTYSPVAAGVTGILAAHASASSGGPAASCDQVAPQIFTDLALQGVGTGTFPALVSSNLKQNQSFTALFFMTQLNTSNPLPGLTVTGQRTFGVGAFGAIAGTVQEVGFPTVGIGAGWYVLNGTPTDSAGAVAAFKMTAANANDSEFTLWFQP